MYCCNPPINFPRILIGQTFHVLHVGFQTKTVVRFDNGRPVFFDKKKKKKNDSAVLVRSCNPVTVLK